MPRKLGGSVRKARQAARREYSILREDKQLAGIEPTTPEGAVHEERVPVGADPPAPELVRMAIRLGWDTPEAGKVKAVDDLVDAIRDEDTKPGMRVRCFQALLVADRAQTEREGG